MFKRTIFLGLSILFICGSFGLLHKFYVSITEISYNPKYTSVEIISTIFTDDLERTLNDEFHTKTHLQSEKENPKTNDFIKTYYDKHFFVTINGKRQLWRFLGKKYDDDTTKTFIEIPHVALDTVKNITIENRLLIKRFPNQKNIIHLKFDRLKKSFILSEDEPQKTVSIPK